MKLFQLIVKHELTLLIRNRFQLLILGLFIALGFYSIQYGHAEISRQNSRITQVQDSMRNEQLKYQAYLTADTTTEDGRSEYEKAAQPSIAKWKYKFVAANTPNPLAALSLGQRDLFPYYYILNTQNLYYQTLKGEIYNPFKLSVGNFDLAFVMIYLLPLLIIGFGFDILSFEKDTGTYTMLRISGHSFRKILFYKLLFKYLLIASITLFIVLAGFMISGANLSSLWLWMIVLLLYNALWFAILLLINSFIKDTSFNASAAISVWILLLIVLPSLLNLFGQNNKKGSAIPLASMMRSRGMADTDSAMNAALSKFYTHYPKLKPTDTTPGEFFHMQGYTAFVTMDQIESAQKMDSFYANIKNQQARLQHFNWINPSVNAQQMLNNLAATDLKTELDFKEALKNFHQQIMWFTNTPLFTNKLLTKADYAKTPTLKFAPPSFQNNNLFKGLMQMIVLILLLSFWGYRNLSEAKMSQSL